MTSAAGNAAPLVNEVKPIKYQVSEYLKDRHPYQPALGFHAHPAKYQGKVFNGYGKEGISQLMLTLNDDDIQNSQKILALKHLSAYISSAEMKIKLIREGIIPILSKAVKHDSPPELKFQVAEILWNIATVPQGQHAIIKQGGLQTLIQISQGKGEAEQDGCASAVKGLARLVFSWEGRSWLLGKEVPHGIALLNEASRPGTTQSGPAAPDAGAAPDDAVQDNGSDFTKALLAVIVDQGNGTAVHWHAVDALAHFTLEDEGLLYCLENDVFAQLGKLAMWLGDTNEWLQTAEGVNIALHIATVIWHVGLNDTCRPKLDTNFVPLVARIMYQTMQGTDGESHLALKAALAGALSSISLHTPMKTAALESLDLGEGGTKKVVDVLIQFLEQANAGFSPLFRYAKENGGQLPQGCKTDLEDIKAVMKNSVQAVRLITEYPKAAEYLEGALSNDEQYKELKRQCYASTQFEERFGVQPL